LQVLADNRTMPHETPRLLAIETSTDALSVAVGGAAALATFQGPGAAQASATLLPAAQDLLAQAGWTLAGLDAIVFARGPGAFTGLRTACAVAQGLAYGARSDAHPDGLPVLPVDTLLALAEEARWHRVQAGEAVPSVIVALLDARMDEMYAAAYRCTGEGLVGEPLSAPCLCAPADLAGWLGQVLPAGVGAADCLLAGNVFGVYADALATVPGSRVTVVPTAAALLRLAPGLLAAGAAVAARDALPLYVRDKVARTTAEREGAA
jgi:tRNA threonylcarbamoyladenosine biosynthesis protein TsaB